MGLFRKDPVMETLKKKADAGDPEALFNMGLGYLVGRSGFKANARKGFQLLEKAALQGHAEAQEFLGRCYQRGDGVRKNDEQGFKWLKKSAEQGNESAYYDVASGYQHGIGVEQNLEEAVYWYTKLDLAEKGHETEKKCLQECLEALSKAERDKTVVSKSFVSRTKLNEKTAQYNGLKETVQVNGGKTSNSEKSAGSTAVKQKQRLASIVQARNQGINMWKWHIILIPEKSYGLRKLRNLVQILLYWVSRIVEKHRLYLLLQKSLQRTYPVIR